ncbi:MAG: C39 family peptidase [bacterium]
MIKTYKQKFYHSCLVTSLLMAGNLGQKLEEKIFFDGEKREYYYYLDSVLASFAQNTDKSVQMLVDNEILTSILQKSLAKFEDRITIEQKPINARLVAEIVQNKPVVIHLDDNYLGDYSHASHFVVVSSFEDGKFEIIDPVDGKVKYLSDAKLNGAFESLKNHIKMSPEIIYIT